MCRVANVFISCLHTITSNEIYRSPLSISLRASAVCVCVYIYLYIAACNRLECVLLMSCVADLY